MIRKKIRHMDTQGLKRNIMKLNLLCSFSNAQGSEFMDREPVALG